MDPLNWYQPHTPRQPFKPDDLRPTCSEKTERNMGCDQFRYCPLRQIRDEQRGPVMVAVEDHVDVPEGEGRRFPSWCFIATRRYFGEHPQPGYSIAGDRIYYTAEDSVSGRDDDGNKVYEGQKWKAVQLPPYPDQGPFYYANDSQVQDDDLLAQREALIAKEKASGGGADGNRAKRGKRRELVDHRDG